MILGFDLSLNHSCCCIMNNPEDFYFEEKIFDPSKWKTLTDLEKDLYRMNETANWANALVYKLEPDFIGIEDLAYLARKTRSLTQLAGIKYFVANSICKYLPLMITPKEWKKAYFGNGNIGKPESLRKLQAKFPDRFFNDNQSDSYCVAWFVYQLNQKQNKTA